METSKPTPLMVDGKAYYTLSSYDPVEVEVNVACTIDEDVDFALESAILELGATEKDLKDPAWVKAHFGLDDPSGLRQFIREQIEDGNAQMAEAMKARLCAEALAGRLMQAIPVEALEQSRQIVEMELEQQFAAMGESRDQLLAQFGGDEQVLSAALDERARTLSEQEAALSAFARQRKLTVSDEELPRLLQLPQDSLDLLLEQAKSAGQLGQVREAALHSKAMEVIVSECSCSYHHETAEDARKRIARARELRARDLAFAKAQEDKKDEGGNPHLRLV